MRKSGRKDDYNAWARRIDKIVEPHRRPVAEYRWKYDRVCKLKGP